MTRRRARNLTGGLLDCPPNVDPASWLAPSILDRMKPAPAPQACRCPARQAGQLGGCRPALRWLGPESLGAYCACCQRDLVAGVNRRRDQSHLIGLSLLPIADLDLADLREWGVLSGERPGDGQGQQDDPAPAGAPDPEAIAAAVQAETRTAWLRRFY
jgi:hypothetical protein